MHQITLSQETYLGKTFGTLSPGSYICADLNAFEIAQFAPRGSVQVEPYRDSGDGGNRICIMRSGAWGDLLLLTPALRAFRAKHPDRQIVISCFPQHFDLFNSGKCVDGCVAYPLPMHVAETIGTIISLENVMELAPDKHATDAFAERLGVTVEDYKPTFDLNPEDAILAGVVTHKPRPVCGIQPIASVANRSYHLQKVAHLIAQLTASGWDVWLFGSEGQIPQMQKEVPHVLDLSRRGLTFRQSAAWLSYCDVFVGVDSALIHLCHALDIQAVGLYAAFPWQNRTGKAPKTFALTGLGECAPCKWHMHAGRQFPPGKPCATAGFCTVLAEITPQRIVTAVNKFKPSHA